MTGRRGPASADEFPPPPEGIVAGLTSSSQTMSSAPGTSTPMCSGAVLSAPPGPGGLTYVQLSNKLGHHQRWRGPDR